VITIDFRKKADHSVTLRISDGNFNTDYTCSDQLEIGRVLENAVEHFHMLRAKKQTADFFRSGI